MKFIMTLLTASVLFLSGLITGYHFAQSHWYKAAPQEMDFSGENIQKDEKESDFDLSKDLLERQDKIKKEGRENIFSSLGRSLDFFNKENAN